MLCSRIRKGISERIKNREVQIMSLNYKGFEWSNRITSDEDSVDRFLHEGLVPQAPSIGDLHGAAEWLATYASETAEDAQGWANVVAFLILTAESKEKRSALAKAKKKFAEEKGIPVSQVRINRNN
jgi:hypothetical protein